MRKVHYKVVLDVFILEDDEVADIHDISVESVEVTDSR